MEENNELAEHYSDMLYKISLAGKPAFIYLLFEHKSYIDKLIAFQLLQNMVKIWKGTDEYHSWRFFICQPNQLRII